MSKELLTEIEAESVRFSQMPGPEWEIEIVRSEGDNIYHYVDMADPIYEQLVESGDIDPESFFETTGEGGSNG